MRILNLGTIRTVSTQTCNSRAMILFDNKEEDATLRLKGKVKAIESGIKKIYPRRVGCM